MMQRQRISAVENLLVLYLRSVAVRLTEIRDWENVDCTPSGAGSCSFHMTFHLCSGPAVTTITANDIFRFHIQRLSNFRSS